MYLSVSRCETVRFWTSSLKARRKQTQTNNAIVNYRLNLDEKKKRPNFGEWL